MLLDKLKEYTSGDLTLSGDYYVELPENLHIKGNFFIFNTKIDTLPNNLRVDGSFHMYNNIIKELPHKMYIGKDLCIEKSIIKFIPGGSHIGRNLFINEKFNKNLLNNEILFIKAFEGEEIPFINGNIYIV